MSIIIPSKNIYDIKNPVVRDNIINQVLCETTSIIDDKEYEILVSATKHDVEDKDLKEETGDPNNNDFGKTINWALGYENGSTLMVYEVGAFCLYDNYQSKNFQIEIPKVANNHLITDIIYGKEDGGSSKIKYTLYGKKEKGTVKGRGAADSSDIYNLVYTKDEEENLTEGSYLIPKEISSRTYEVKNESGVQWQTAKANAKFYDNSTIYEPIIYDNYADSIHLSFSIVCGVRITECGGSYSRDPLLSAPQAFDVNGTYEEFIPTRIEINIYGNTIGISLEDTSIRYGDGDKPYSINGNELVQNDNSFLAEKVLEQYENGKETATILCDINDFRDDSGVLAISPNPLKDVALKFIASLEDENDVRYINHTFEVARGEIRQNDELRYSQIIQYTALNSATQGNQITLREMKSVDTYYFESGKIYDFSFAESVELPMTFEIGDWVIPMVKNPNSPTEDMPMSKKSDGTAKQFRVVGIDFVYDGAVWQKLSLQEV
jgi:hypothetical protein